jgi:hypothetical protein
MVEAVRAAGAGQSGQLAAKHAPSAAEVDLDPNAIYALGQHR